MTVQFMRQPSGEGGWLFKSILFFINWISVYFFRFLKKKYYHIMFVIVVFWLRIPTPLLLPSSSVSLSYFILAVPKLECLGKHSCMSCPFHIAILNGKLFFRETIWSKWSKCRLSKTNYNIQKLWDKRIIYEMTV